ETIKACMASTACNIPLVTSIETWKSEKGTARCREKDTRPPLVYHQPTERHTWKQSLKRPWDRRPAEAARRSSLALVRARWRVIDRRKPGSVPRVAGVSGERLSCYQPRKESATAKSGLPMRDAAENGPRERARVR